MKKYIYKALGININKRSMITFVGGGGKTSTIIALAQEMKKIHKTVLVTTTTHMYSSIVKLEDKPYITVVGGEKVGEKIKGLSPLIIDKIYRKDLYDFILVEGDGAKGRPIKGVESFEPVIPKETNMTIGVIGIDCLGKPINMNYVHRPEIFTKLVNKDLEESIDIDSIVNLTLAKKGIFKNSKGENILFINKIENNKDLILGKRIKSELEKRGFNNVILGSIKTKKFLG